MNDDERLQRLRHDAEIGRQVESEAPPVYRLGSEDDGEVECYAAPPAAPDWDVAGEPTNLTAAAVDALCWLLWLERAGIVRADHAPMLSGAISALTKFGADGVNGAEPGWDYSEDAQRYVIQICMDGEWSDVGRCSEAAAAMIAQGASEGAPLRLATRYGDVESVCHAPRYRWEPAQDRREPDAEPQLWEE